MKNIIFKTMLGISLMIVATISGTSCTKDNDFAAKLNALDESITSAAETYDLALRFQAEDITEATVYFYDKDLVQVAVENIVVPESSSEVVNSVFVSESAPEWVYTPGLQNAEDNGMIRVGGKSVKTKAGGDDSGAVLLVIKKN